MSLLSTFSARARMVFDSALDEGEVVGAGAFAPVAGKQNAFAQVDGDMASRMSWETIRRSDEFRGRWVALDECRYDEATGRATEGAVVDVDDDLVELCARIRESERTNCAILFCGDEEEAALETVPSVRH